MLGVATGRAALEALDRGHFDVVFLDLWLGPEAGMDLLPEMLQRQADLGVIVVTAFASIESAVDAVKRGAVDYIPEAVHARSDPADRESRAGGAASQATSRRTPGGARRDRRARRLRVAQPDLSPVPATAARAAALRRGRLAPRRERHRQERAGALAACEQSARRRALCHRQLSGACPGI